MSHGIFASWFFFKMSTVEKKTFIIITFWLCAKIHFTCTKPPSYLFTVSNLKQFSQWIYKKNIYKYFKYHIWHRATIYVTCPYCSYPQYHSKIQSKNLCTMMKSCQKLIKHVYNFTGINLPLYQIWKVNMYRHLIVCTLIKRSQN